MMDSKTASRFLTGLWGTIKRYWFSLFCGGAGFLIHAGTALLRINTFFPYPKLLDFAGFYAAAWAIRQGQSPYSVSVDWLRALQLAQDIPFLPPLIYNPPFWPWLLQPLTLFNFPTAVSVWVLLNLALLAWATLALSQIMGWRGWKKRLFLFVLVLTFGPVFLDLTLGQTSIVLLVASLVVGRSLGSQRRAASFVAAVANGFAAGAKFFPLAWLAIFPFLRRWRETVLTVVVVAGIFTLGFLATPAGSREYAQHFMERLSTSSEVPSLDDQSLIAWLDRLGRPLTFEVPGLNPEQRKTVVWAPPWALETGTIRLTGYILLALLVLPYLLFLIRAIPEQPEASFYLWVLYCLLALLHMERYNHVLLLPAMAWLWRQGGGKRNI
ncbi:MAG: glycosyltransferase family 87 protein, partial [Anaerolineae bacterium]